MQQQQEMLAHLEQKLAHQQQQLQQQQQQQAAMPSELQQMATLLAQQAETQRLAQRDHTMQLSVLYYATYLCLRVLASAFSKRRGAKKSLHLNRSTSHLK